MKYRVKIMAILIALFQGYAAIAEVPAQVAAFKKALQDSTTIANCANCDFRGTQELAGVSAPGAHLPGVTFQPCIPNESNKTTVMLCVPGLRANLTGLKIPNANLFSSCLDEVVADNADFSHVEMSNSSAQYASFKGANFTGIITNNSTFCNAIMPDGKICKETWTGQGVTIACNCTTQEAAALAEVEKVIANKKKK